MIFIETSRGSVPMSRIVRATPSADGKRMVVDIDSDGDDRSASLPITSWDYELGRAVHSLTPAAPGTFALWGHLAQGEHKVSQSTVIAWAICADGELRPVTTEGVNDGSGDSLPILHPNGCVDVVGVGTFPTLEEWAAWDEARLRDGEAT
jgi:hypothetical protein